jgi:excisionase family DNA binding protein
VGWQDVAAATPAGRAQDCNRTGGTKIALHEFTPVRTAAELLTQNVDAPDAPLLFDPETAAKFLAVSLSFVHKLIRLKLLPSVKVGRCRRVTRAALVDYVNSLPS